jgi:uncharacterized repeat protein (TIGR01451 family)
VSDLRVRKHVSHAIARVGQPLTYTITVTSQGPDQATNVGLTDTPTLPARVLSIHAGQGRCCTGPPLTCALGRLRAARATVTMTSAGTVPGTQTNAAAVMSGSWDPDPSTSNATATTTILALPRVTGAGR